MNAAEKRSERNTDARYQKGRGIELNTGLGNRFQRRIVIGIKDRDQLCRKQKSDADEQDP